MRFNWFGFIFGLTDFSFHLFLQFPWNKISILPLQWHALAFGLFASIIAPFGGFFASGFKRAFKIKVFAKILQPMDRDEKLTEKK